MKKILLLIVVTISLLLTGCLNASGEITRLCSKEENAGSFKEKIEYKITFKEDIILKTEIIKTYTSNEILPEELVETLDSSKNQLEDVVGFKYNVDKKPNQYIITYTIDNKKTTEDIKNKFDLKETFSSQTQSFKSSGVTCEK